MRKLLRSTPFLQTARNSVPEYRPESNEQKFKDWWSRLNSLSNKPASKVYLAQLSNLFAYYNRQVSDSTSVEMDLCRRLTLILGGERSFPRDWWIRFNKVMKIWQARNTTSTKSSIASSPKIQKPSTRSYTIHNQEQLDGFPHCRLADQLRPLRAMAV